jgi:hypothetical protein
MSLPNELLPIGLLGTGTGAAVEEGYNIERSVRLNSADSAYLNRTPASAGNRKTWTWAGWVKKSGTTAGENILGARGGTGTSTSFTIQFGGTGYGAGTDQLVIGYAGAAWKVTSQVFRDHSAWYHIVVAFDSTNATGSDRIKLYVNGIQVTSFNTDSAPSLNLDSAINSTVEHRIGSYASASAQYLNGYLADIHLIDGQALAATDFGEFDATTGVWNPKAYTGTYGTNGFHLPFSDNSSNAALGTVPHPLPQHQVRYRFTTPLIPTAPSKALVRERTATAARLY